MTRCCWLVRTRRAAAVALTFLACRAHEIAAGKPEEREPGAPAAQNDDSRCEFKGRVDRHVEESVGTGALQPTIRRVYRVVGQAEQRRRILVCREVDTNMDGLKDLVRYYDDEGEAVEERADTDYDGEIDTWIRFDDGRIARVAIDHDGDGNPEETRYYQRGMLSRVQRDRNGDGKPDVWEIYAGGRLERMGVDMDHDGRVDRWNRDEVQQGVKPKDETSDPTSPPEAAGSVPQSGETTEGGAER